MTEGKRQGLHGIRRKIVLVAQDLSRQVLAQSYITTQHSLNTYRVMGRARGSQKTTMGLEVKVKLGRVSDLPIDDSSRRAVARFVPFTRFSREESRDND